jgi:hypothetical protein
MAKTSVIREFLVKLGYKTDEHSKKAFEQGVTGATKRVVALSSAVAAAATVVAAGTARMAYHLSRLEYTSARTGSSAAALFAFGHSAAVSGSSVAAATAAVEGLAQKLRENPYGMRTFLSRMGVDLTDAHGQARGTVSLLMQAAQRFKALRAAGRGYQAFNIARVLGIDPKQLLAMTSPKFVERFQRIKKAADAAHLDLNARRGLKLTRQLAALNRQFFLLGTEAAAALEQAFGPDLQHFIRWLQQNGPAVAKQITQASRTVTAEVKALTHWFEKANSATHGWLSTLGEIAGALWLISKSPFGRIAGGLAKIGAAALAYKGLKKAATGASRGAAAGGAEAAEGAAAEGAGGLGLLRLLLGWRGLAAAAIVGGAYELSKHALSGTKFGDQLRFNENRFKWSVLGDKAARDAVRKSQNAPDYGKNGWYFQGWGKTIEHGMGAIGDYFGSLKYRPHSLAQQKLQNQAMAFFERHGYTAAQAAGLVANLRAESGLNKAAVGDHGKAYGLAQWHKDRQADFARVFGHSMRQSKGLEQLKFVLYELHHKEAAANKLLLATHNAAAAGRVVSRAYERPAASAAEAGRRGQMAQSIEHHTPMNITIQVHGAHDPNETARTVARHLDRQHRAIVRHTAAVAQ